MNPNAALAALALFPALALGSFLNVVAARVPARRSIVHAAARPAWAAATRSGWRDNIPSALVRAPARHAAGAAARRSRCAIRRVELVTALLVVACVLAVRAHRRGGRRRRLLRRPGRRSPRSTSSTGSSRTGSCCRRRRSGSSRRPSIYPSPEWVVAALGALAASSSSPRSPTRPGWGWATSSSRCCWARCSAGPSPWR